MSTDRLIYASIYLQLHSAYKYTHTHITSIPVNVSTNSAFVFAKQIQLIFRFECRFLFLLFVFLSLLIRSFACLLLACLRPACRFVRFLFSCSDTIVHLCILPMSISVFLANARASVIISLNLILKRLSSFLAKRQCVYVCYLQSEAFVNLSERTMRIKSINLFFILQS